MPKNLNKQRNCQPFRYYMELYAILPDGREHKEKYDCLAENRVHAVRKGVVMMARKYSLPVGHRVEVVFLYRTIVDVRRRREVHAVVQD